MRINVKILSFIGLVLGVSEAQAGSSSPVYKCASSSCYINSYNKMDQDSKVLLSKVNAALGANLTKDPGFCVPTSNYTALSGYAAQNNTVLPAPFNRIERCSGVCDKSLDDNANELVAELVRRERTSLSGGGTSSTYAYYQLSSIIPNMYYHLTPGAKEDLTEKMKLYNNPISISVSGFTSSGDVWWFLFGTFKDLTSYSGSHGLTVVGMSGDRLLIEDPWGTTYFVEVGTVYSRPNAWGNYWEPVPRNHAFVRKVNYSFGFIPQSAQSYGVVTDAYGGR